MALNSSGPISLGGTATGASIAVELGGSGTSQISLNDANVRTLAGVPAGAITIPTDFYGKSNTFFATISSDQTNLNLRTWALANGWDGNSNIQITINGGVNIYSTSTGTPALTVNGSWPNGVAVVNNGKVIGRGGNGGNGGTFPSTPGGTGGNGGTALSVASALTMTNNGDLAGGGGGGGGGSYGGFAPYFWGGSGGGGGAGNGVKGAAGSGTGANSGNPGVDGTLTSQGAGGTARGFGGAGGSGGAWGTAGTDGSNTNYGARGVGGTAGSAVVGTSNITWLVTGNRYGPIS
jgi:hypothetical protein